MSDLDSLVYKYLLENGQTEAAQALKKKSPSVSISPFFVSVTEKILGPVFHCCCHVNQARKKNLGTHSISFILG